MKKVCFFAQIAVFFACDCALAASPTRYRIEEVPAKPSAILSDISDNGSVVFWTPPGGELETDELIATRPGRVYVVPVGASPQVLAGRGGGWDRVRDINASGTSVGDSRPGGFLTSTRAVTWDASGKLFVLPDVTPGQRAIYARSVNDTGDILVDASGDRELTNYIWNGSDYELIPKPPSGVAYWSLINNRREVLGRIETNEGTTQAAIHKNGVTTALGSLSGGRSFPVALNNNGVVIGGSANNANEIQFFRWTANSGIEAIDYIGPDVVVGGFNDSDTIVGYLPADPTDITITDAVIFEQGGDQQLLTDLVVNGDSWNRLSTAEAINNRGQIIGYGILNGSGAAFLLTPVPEPHAIVLGLVGFFAVSYSLRKRSPLELG